MTTLRVWGNHHFMNKNNKFEETFKKTIQVENICEDPILYNIGSQCLSDRFIRKLRRFIDAARHSPQVHVIALGDIDVNKGVSGERIVTQLYKIAKLANKRPQLKIVINAIIPRGIPDDSQEKFNCIEINREIHRTLKFLPRVVFVNTDFVLLPSDYTDSYTLNDSGGVKLAHFLALAIKKMSTC